MIIDYFCCLSIFYGYNLKLVEIKKAKKKIEFYLEKFFQKKERENKSNPFFRLAIEKIKQLTLGKGKRIRALLFYLGFLAVSEKRKEEALKTSIFLELLHSYLLIHDDIIDSDTLRRNKPTTWKSYQNYLQKIKVKEKQEELAKSLAIVAGDLCCSWAYQVLFESKFPKKRKENVFFCLGKMLEKVIYGQFLDIILPFRKNVKKNEIVKMYSLKTASYTLQYPFLLGALLAGASPKRAKEMSSFGLPLGIAFQIQDDILDLWGERRKIGKPLGSDLKEGKKTLLSYFALKKANKKEKIFLQKLRKKKTIKESEIEKVKEIFISTLSLKKNREIIKRLVEKSKKEISLSKMRKKAKKELLFLADYLEKRNV